MYLLLPLFSHNFPGTHMGPLNWLLDRQTDRNRHCCADTPHICPFCFAHMPTLLPLPVSLSSPSSPSTIHLSPSPVLCPTFSLLALLCLFSLCLSFPFLGFSPYYLLSLFALSLSSHLLPACLLSYSHLSACYLSSLSLSACMPLDGSFLLFLPFSHVSLPPYIFLYHMFCMSHDSAHTHLSVLSLSWTFWFSFALLPSFFSPFARACYSLLPTALSLFSSCLSPVPTCLCIGGHGQDSLLHAFPLFSSCLPSTHTHTPLPCMPVEVFTTSGSLTRATVSFLTVSVSVWDGWTTPFLLYLIWTLEHYACLYSFPHRISGFTTCLCMRTFVFPHYTPGDGTACLPSLLIYTIYAIYYILLFLSISLWRQFGQVLQTGHTPCSLLSTTLPGFTSLTTHLLPGGLSLSPPLYPLAHLPLPTLPLGWFSSVVLPLHTHGVSSCLDFCSSGVDFSHTLCMPLLSYLLLAHTHTCLPVSSL